MSRETTTIPDVICTKCGGIIKGPIQTYINDEGPMHPSCAERYIMDIRPKRHKEADHD